MLKINIVNTFYSLIVCDCGREYREIAQLLLFSRENLF
jgi:hypothetical protein